MTAYRQNATVTQDCTVVLNDLPFTAGQIVEVIVLSEEIPASPSSDPNSDAEYAFLSGMSKTVLRELWDNEEDAVYDNL